MLNSLGLRAWTPVPRPYSEQDYPYNPSLNYGRSDYNVSKAFKLFGMWQPVFFHGSRSWIEKIAGGWSLSGILNLHSGFPWTPVVNVLNGNLYCGQCGYSSLPAVYLGGAGTSTSNDQFKTGSNYPNDAEQYFSGSRPIPPTAAPTSETRFLRSVHRNSLNGPGYRDVDITLAKSFGLPNNTDLGRKRQVRVPHGCLQPVQQFEL